MSDYNEGGDMDVVLPYDRYVFYALSDETREKILKFVCQNPAKISELAKALGITPQGVLKHVKILKKAGLIDEKKNLREAGKPLTISPSKKVLELDLPFLHDIPLYQKARKLLNQYRQAADVPEEDLLKEAMAAEETKVLVSSTGERVEINNRLSITELTFLLSDAIRVLKFHNAKILLLEDIKVAEDFTRLCFIDSSLLDIENELKNSDQPIAKLAIDELQKIRNKIPALEPKTHEFVSSIVYSAYHSLMNALKREEEKKIMRRPESVIKDFKLYQEHLQALREKVGLLWA
jgi:predicted transcriptional regulator